jgi:precorrin-3B C17-methyltransferase
MLKETDNRESNSSGGKGRILVIGTGPGQIDELTARATTAIKASEVIVGYDTYLDLIKELTASKETFSSGMRGEVERCKKAIEFANAGKQVALISGGDAGIYAMAGLVLELAEADSKNSLIEVEVVPGIPAFVSAASLLGAPLMHDFASISLSDLLTPWDKIKARLKAAASADFVIALYNPKSRKRITQIEEAARIILEARSNKTPVGIVKNASRAEEKIIITTLGELSRYFDEIDMSTIVIIGNNETFISEAGKMITPRGYPIECKKK